MPGLAQRNEQYSSASFGFWSKHRDDVSYNQLQKFWSELPLQARQELLRIDKHTLFEQARKNMYCSRCNGLLLEGFLQIVMYGKSLQQEGVAGGLHYNRPGVAKYNSDGGSSITNGSKDENQNPSVHPWGGLTTSRDGLLTLLDCYLCSKSLKSLQNVFDSARARERERELLYPDACGGGGRGWISQGIASYGRGHGTRETCALHTARLSCDTLVDFWSALGEETRLSLLKMKEEDFIERLMYRFDSKRFCRDCRRNVIREFKEMKELKRMRREPRCTSWFCVADTAFLYEVSDDTIQADWSQTFADTIGTYHHFEWAVGTGEGKSDILEFENVGMNGSVQVNGLDLDGLTICYITLRAWKLDGRCSEISVKAHALKGHQCVHCRLVVGDGYVTITRGESIRSFFEHAEEAEEEEDDDSMDKDGNELDGECSRPQKHAKSPELAREFLLDAATVIFKEQACSYLFTIIVFKNAHSIFVSLAVKLLEERVYVACKEIITLEKQMKLLEEEEREKREEEERKERKRTKEREKKLRRKERLKGKEREREKKCAESITPVSSDIAKEDSSLAVEVEENIAITCRGSVSDTGDIIVSRPASPDVQGDRFLDGNSNSSLQNHSFDSPDGDGTKVKDGNGSFIMEQLKFSRRRLKFHKDGQLDPSMKWSDRCRFAVVSESAPVNRSEPRHQRENFEASSRNFGGLNRQSRISNAKSNGRNGSVKYSEKFRCSNGWSDRYDFYSCSCVQHNEYRAKTEPHVSETRVSREPKSVRKTESKLAMSKQVNSGNKYNQQVHRREDCGNLKHKIVSRNNLTSRDSLHSKKVWEPIESHKIYPRSNSDTVITLRTSTYKEGDGPNDNFANSSSKACSSEASVNLGEIGHEHSKVNRLRNTNLATNNDCYVETQDQCSSLNAGYEEVGICPNRNPTLNAIPHSMICSTSNSDKCSSCLSEGDSNTSTSHHGNLESSSTSDSEDACQQSDRRDTSICIKSGFSEFQVKGMDKKQEVNRGVTLESQSLFGHPLDGTENKDPGNLPKKPSENSDNGKPTAFMGSQRQGMFASVKNQHTQFPVYQAPSTMSFYHQNPVSWPATPSNGLVPFAPPNPYLYTGPLGYGLNRNSHLCMQYGTLQHLAAPPFNPGHVPVYQPVLEANGLYAEEQTQISKSGTENKAFTELNAERVVPGRLHATEAAANGEGKQNDVCSKSHTDDTSFSLFHFGGPVALKDEIVEELSQFSADCVENGHGCNKKKSTVEQYNLFAASNGIRFSFF
ncbi:metal tolerance protein 4 [Hibiscus syriacus]|uniref:Metal tolerance protein 4 n=1 Tax=Hibiscus syriacus TaxID=106335 RepID=A0A6A2XEZ3_HIBSY|nr:metal tolerance protein 4 [Hibiscus syriacus]